MTYIFESGLAHHIEGLIQQKRADGYAYNSEEKLLKRFDTFCVQNYPELTTVTYEMAAKWSEARPGEGDAYHNRCMSIQSNLDSIESARFFFSYIFAAVCVCQKGDC